MGILSKKEVAKIAEFVAAKVDIPKIPEWGEVKLIELGIEALDEGLSKHVASDWADIIKDAAKGLSGQSVQGLKEKIISEVNKKIDLPMTSEEFEAVILSHLYDVIAELITKGKAV